MSEITITYEVLFEIMRNEKSATELQTLPENFYSNVSEYIQEKQDLLKKDDELFSISEKKQVITILENLEKILSDIYNRREKKIIELAIVKSKTKSSLVNTTNMQDSEIVFYEKLLVIFDKFRTNILHNILNAKSLNMEFSTDSKEKVKSNIVTVRFLEDVDKFVDANLNDYGPYEKETIATLPIELASPLEEACKLELLE